MTKILAVVLLASAVRLHGQGFGDLRDVERLPPCTGVSAVTPDTWPAVSFEASTLSIRTPPDAVRRDDRAACVHGCETWQRNTLTVRIVHGAFGAMSFPSQSLATACTKENAGVRHVELPGQDERSVVVWPLPVPDENGGITVSTTDFLIEVSWTSDRDRLDALRVIDSLRRRAP